MNTLAILHASELVTLAGSPRPRTGGELNELSIIKDGGILIREGKIASIDKTPAIEADLPANAEVIDAAGRLVLPGFVDAHTHLVFGGDRLDDYERRARGETYEQIAAAGGGIWSTVEKTRSASAEELFEQAKRHAGWLLRSGTTTAEAKSGYGLTLECELKILRTIGRIAAETALDCVPTFLGAHAVPKEDRSEPNRYIRRVVEE